jgi:hypothetical protein
LALARQDVAERPVTTAASAPRHWMRAVAPALLSYHVGAEFGALLLLVQPVIFEAVAVLAVAAFRFGGDVVLDGGCHGGRRRQAEVPVHRLNRVDRVADQVHVMNVTDRFGEAGVVAHRHHALRAVEPAPALVRTERPRVEAAGEGAAEDLG